MNIRRNDAFTRNLLEDRGGREHSRRGVRGGHSPVL